MRLNKSLLVLALTALLAVPAGAQEKPRYGGELVFTVPSEMPSYDGHREQTFGLIHPIAPHYNTLLRVDPTDPTGTKPAPDLAESWTASKDGLVYTFKLRRGVKFHDGSEMTSKDVKASYDKIIFPPSGCVFHPRCPIAVDRCRDEVPTLREIRPRHWAACLLA